MAGGNDPLIIIKKIEENDDHAHHGGGWKVAYADFMTAMMAFFLLLWILAASDEEKLRGLADYFTPSLSDSGGRGEGLLDGIVLGPDGVMSGTDGPKSDVQLPSFGQENPLSVFDSRLRDEKPQVVVEYETRPEGTKSDTTAGAGEAAEPSDVTTPDPEARDPLQTARNSAEAADATRQAAEREAEMTQLEASIIDTVAGRDDLADLAQNLRFQRTPEGLDIQIVDRDGRSMFATGSARIEDRTRQLLRVIGEAIVDLPNTLTISGHTDAVPYTRTTGYSNWELSADRANATRRVLVDTGIAQSRITRISGVAATRPLTPDDPTAAENRRISVTLNYPAALR
ncbi:flagellar motor protein MotB [Pseudooceanicola aestuarii]|uniref:flagellar motor protein MotB n=1 Tax=Pseudooceanicola aestuarii TaxID=2697319 RepID=UPI0013D6FA0D|nr:flagellar motor protein MotB [Pseudooceanicola aestuarii]